MPQYFHFHSDETDFDHKLESHRCTAIRPNGQQCKKNTVMGLKYCYIHNKTQLHLQIKDSTIPQAGKGLFAVGKPNTIIFQDKQRICLYNGQLIDIEELIKRYGNDTGPYGIELHNHQFEDAAIKRGIGSLANHTNNKRKINARLSINKNNRAQLIATKNIKSGMEICFLIDYGDEYRFDENVESSTNNRK